MADKKPIIFSVDDDPQVLKSIKGDLRNRYRKSYRIISVDSAQEALDALPELRNRGEEVALFLSDQRMPEMNGVEFLKRAKTIFPLAKRALLTAYSEVDAAIKAINEVQLDYYLTKPWNPPEEKLYPVVDELLDEYTANREAGYRGLKLIAHQNNPQTHEIKEFLSGNLVPYRFIDPRSQVREAEPYLQLNELTTADYPVVILEDGQVLRKTTIQEVALAIGLKAEAQYELYDVVVVGSGPAGLAAAVYGGSEGLRTAIIEKMAPGGQAGTSSRIENYLGFPNGVSGMELSRRAYAQALKFGVEFLSPAEVDRLELDEEYKKLHLKSGKTLISKAVILATGMTYRRHPAKGMDALAGISVYYGAATTEAMSCSNKRVVIVGGGNSAGQGAVYLSNFAKEVVIMVRRPDLQATMSSYLIDQIEAIDNIEVRGYTEIHEVIGGEEHIEQLKLYDKQKEAHYTEKADAVFVFIGTRPNTDWLGQQLLRSDKGFLLTGRDVVQHPNYEKAWRESREPMALETCIPGIFAVGDVRSGAMNRVAAAVGEGSMSIKMTHEYLASK
ncbi:MAG: FAD-dependent oxidoreductase [Bacteroidota bacterium]